jgi:WD40 repeat protein
MLKRFAALGSVVLGASLLAAALADAAEPSGKIVYEDYFITERGTSPAIVVFDLATRSHKVVATSAYRPRWLQSGQEIAYFRPDQLSNGLVEISNPADASERLLGPGQIRRYGAILPGRTIIVGMDGAPRRELKHFVTDIDVRGRVALTLRPRAAPGMPFRRRSGDILLQDMSTGEISMLLTSEQISDERGEALRYARWMGDAGVIVYQTESVARNEAGNLMSSWALYIADVKTGKRAKLPVASGLPFENSGPYDFAPSPEGKTIAFSVVENRDLWSYDVAKGASTKIELGERSYRKDNPVFSPDGRFIVFELTDQTDAYGTTSLWVAPSGGGTAHRVLPRSWRHVIRFLVLVENHRSADWWQPR